jgi:hypothetical protein
MTAAARASRWERLRAEALERNPDLYGEDLERAAQLLMRAEMARLTLARERKRQGRGRT